MIATGALEESKTLVFDDGAMAILVGELESVNDCTRVLDRSMKTSRDVDDAVDFAVINIVRYDLNGRPTLNDAIRAIMHGLGVTFEEALKRGLREYYLQHPSPASG